MAGRDACPKCDSRDTERVGSSRRKANTECHGCGAEFTVYLGPDCPTCESNNTRRRTTRVDALTTRTEIVCFACGRNKFR